MPCDQCKLFAQLYWTHSQPLPASSFILFVQDIKKRAFWVLLGRGVGLFTSKARKNYF